MMDTRPVVELEEGWEIMQMGITKVIKTIEGVPGETPMEAACLMNLITTVYNMCTQKPPHDFSGKLYEWYACVFNDYLPSRVLPFIQEKKDDVSMLQELVKRWENHKVMVKKLSQPFNYLDRYYIPRNSFASLKDVGFGCFHRIVYEEMKVRVNNVVISLINQEREGNEIDQTLVKNVLEIFVDLGNKDETHNMVYYVNDFETPFLNDTADYYTRNQEEQALKAEECLKKENVEIISPTLLGNLISCGL